MKTIKQEQAGSVFGVPGRFFAVTVCGDDQTIERCRGRIASQKFISESRPIDGHGTTSQTTADKWVSVLTKLGKVSQKQTIEESHKYDAQRGIVDYVDVTKVYCTIGA